MDEYPTEKELQTIREWECLKYEDFVALAEYVVNLWHFDDWARLTGKKIKTLRLATGGWSGNEDIVAALDKNPMFSMVCWEMSKRGGLHIYKIPFLKSAPQGDK